MSSMCLIAAIAAFSAVVCTVGGTNYPNNAELRKEAYPKTHFQKPITQYPTKQAKKEQKYMDQYQKYMDKYYKQMQGRGKRQASGFYMEDAVPTFDWRFANSGCQSVQDVRKEKCDDSGVVAAVNSISDRYCLATGQNKFFSELDVVNCEGCGTSASLTFNFYVTLGLTTGGDPESSIPEPNGCLPSLNVTNPSGFYFCPQMSCQWTGPQQLSSCTSTCVDNSPLDFHFGNTSNSIIAGADMDAFINATMWEVFHHGPGVVLMAVYSDLFNAYPPNSPIDVTATYTGPQPGATMVKFGHAVRLIGWGTDQNGTKYWTIMNQWGPGWGNNGTINIARGVLSYWSVDHTFDFAYPAEMFP